MALSDPSLVWLLALLTVGLPVAAVVLWHRIPGPRPVVLSARLASVVASQLAAVLLVGVALNDYAYFYGSWGDLWSSVTQTVDNRYPVSPVTYRHQASGARPAGVTLVASGTAPQSVPPARWPRAGRLESVHIQGDVSQLGTQAYVYLPPQYFQPAYRHTLFPATEVLTGYPGNDLNLVRRMDYPARSAQEVAAGRARPMVLVMMRSSDAYPRDAECTDVPGGPQALTMFTEDVPYDVIHAYRVRPTGWGAIGDSTGGYCSAKIVMESSYTFSAGVSLSGYYHTLQDATTGNLWGGSAVLRDLNDLEWRLRHLQQPPVSLLLTSSRGEGGPNGLADLRTFVSLAHPPLRVTTLILRHGGHSIFSWDRELGPALDWLSAHLW